MLIPTSTPAAGLHRAMLAAPTRQLFASNDVQETRALVARVMKPHALNITGGRQRLQARMHHLALGDVSVSRLCYGAEVSIEPGELDDFFLVMMPLQGNAQVRSGFDTLESHPDLASVVSAHLGTAMRWSADCDQLMVRIARPFLERMLTAQLGRELDAPLQFALGLRWKEQPAWQCLVRYLVDWAEQAGDMSEHKLLVGQMEQMVATSLLSCQSHNFSDEPLARRSTVLPRHVRRVQEYLQAHAHANIRAEVLAEIAGVSLRSLYAGFHDFCGESPMQYLRNIRLERARGDLLAGPVGGGVASVALRWGFAHMGRFSAEYKERFGESPSQTLKRV
ncbi:MAG: AraC family transcriptional regulator [Aquabacterium sp.]|jgi:AraC-like DNA-binding protein|uniref:AraC family transcriptional regulator n=1 Tax=Aquabacterium sp. TaxID=1872578 RepID=UPI003BB0D618